MFTEFLNMPMHFHFVRLSKNNFYDRSRLFFSLFDDLVKPIRIVCSIWTFSNTIFKIQWLFTVQFRTCWHTSKTNELTKTNDFLRLSEQVTVGFFWLNAAEGWIDVSNDKLNTKVKRNTPID